MSEDRTVTVVAAGLGCAAIVAGLFPPVAHFLNVAATVLLLLPAGLWVLWGMLRLAWHHWWMARECRYSHQPAYVAPQPEDSDA